MKKLKSIIEKFVLMSFVAFAAALFIPIGVSASVTGSGTKSSPYVVDTYKDLSNTLYKGKKDETIYIRLGADISKSGYNGNAEVYDDTTVYLDLYGHKIDGASISYAYGYGIIVKGNLILNDTKGGGKITHCGESGVFVYGSFTMNGGTITNNYVGIKHGDIIMNGGSISDNTGMGVLLEFSKLTMNGGVISDNQGGGVYVGEFSYFNVSGNSRVYGNTKDGTSQNVYLVPDKEDEEFGGYEYRATMITVTGHLTGKIGVTSDQHEIFAEAASTYNYGKLNENDLNAFFSDKGCTIKLNSDKKGIVVAEIPDDKVIVKGNLVYDKTDKSSAVSVTGYNNGTDYTVSFMKDGVTVHPINAGEYTAIVKGKGVYAGNEIRKTLIIEKKPVKVTGITGKNKVYDGTNIAELDYSGVVIDGVLSGDNVSVTATGKFTNKHASDLKKTVLISDIIFTGASGNNYELTSSGSQTETTAFISKAEAEIKAEDKSKKFGEKDPKLTAVVTPKSAENELAYELKRTEGENPGEYDIFVILHGDNKNYDITTLKGKFNITEVDSSGDSKSDESKAPTVADPAAEAHKVGDIVADGGASYTITSTENGKQTVTYAKPESDTATSATVPESITVDNKEYKVTEIAAGAFKGNKKLKKITIGKNIEKIGSKAFYKCKNLKSVKIKTTALTKKSVGGSAFKGIHPNAKVKVPKKKLKDYQKILKSKGIKGKDQKISK
ncbi:YDG domain-containing protein [Butyrivibrio sp. INlla16]|uniref:YDG domain-containing protein n=1 Tax=Butyrivibrio sp. INlla16 TaxID=1520807 RepID=UPI00087F0F9A|nr:Leucine rich repeat-containing protein [Butyrivibrio sp. INlla16]